MLAKLGLAVGLRCQPYLTFLLEPGEPLLEGRVNHSQPRLVVYTSGFKRFKMPGIESRT